MVPFPSICRAAVQSVQLCNYSNLPVKAGPLELAPVPRAALPWLIYNPIQQFHCLAMERESNFTIGKLNMKSLLLES